jgi:hypothetical protein
LVGSVIAAAVLGIALVLLNTWGWFEIRVILTTITIAVASVVGLACDLSRTPRGINALPIAGLILTTIAAVMILLGMWADIKPDAFWKTTASIAIFAVAATHVSLLSIARLAGNFRWVYFIACQIIFGLAILLVAIIFFEIDVDRTFRFIAALAILDTAVTLIIPILHRIGKSDPQSRAASLLDQNNIASIDAEILRLKRQLADLERLKLELAGEPAQTASGAN